MNGLSHFYILQYFSTIVLSFSLNFGLYAAIKSTYLHDVFIIIYVCVCCVCMCSDLIAISIMDRICTAVCFIIPFRACEGSAIMPKNWNLHIVSGWKTAEFFTAYANTSTIVTTMNRNNQTDTYICIACQFFNIPLCTKEYQHDV